MGVLQVIGFGLFWTPDSALPPDALPSTDLAPLFQAFAQHQWKLVTLLLASLTVGLFVRLLKDDTWFPTIPKQWRALAAFGFGIAGGVLAHVLAGVGWGEAIGGGMVAAWGAIFGHVTLIEGLRSGAEIPMPAWLRKAPPVHEKLKDWIISESEKEDSVPPTPKDGS